MNGASLQSLAKILTERSLNSAVEGLLLTAVVWGVFRLIGRQDARSRFAMWYSTLLSVVLLPLFGGFGFAHAHLPAVSNANRIEGITLASYWVLYLFAAWAVIAGLMLLRLGVGIWRVRRFRNDCADVALVDLNPAIARMLGEFSAVNRVKLCVSGDIAVPAAIGFLRPVIVFPDWLLPQLSAEEIQIILPHELAHLRRWDLWTNLGQKILKALFIFHPAVWWIDNRLTLEREMACDEIVLAESASPKDYAAFLISFAEKLQSVRGVQLAQALVDRMRHMSLRVAQILDEERPCRMGFWNPGLGVGAAVLVIAFGVAPYTPRLIAFQSQPSEVPSALAQAKPEEAQPLRASYQASHREAKPVTQKLAFDSQSHVQAQAADSSVPTAAVHSRSVKNGRAVGLSAIYAKATNVSAPRQETFFIVETAQYDSTGVKIWTLCVWRVEEGKAGKRQLQWAVAKSI